MEFTRSDEIGERGVDHFVLIHEGFAVEFVCSDVDVQVHAVRAVIDFKIGMRESFLQALFHFGDEFLIDGLAHG